MGCTSTLAIDPGPEKSGFVVWANGAVVHSGHERNDAIREFMGHPEFMGWPRFCLMAIEMFASYGMAVGAPCFETCVQIGRFIEKAELLSIETRRIFRKDVRMFVCRSMKAKDANIRQSLLDCIGPVGRKDNPGPLYGVKTHAWAALAIAVTATNDPRMPGHVGCAMATEGARS